MLPHRFQVLMKKVAIRGMYFYAIASRLDRINRRTAIISHDSLFLLRGQHPRHRKGLHLSIGGNAFAGIRLFREPDRHTISRLVIVVRHSAHVPQLHKEKGVLFMHTGYNSTPRDYLFLGVNSRSVSVSSALLGNARSLAYYQSAVGASLLIVKGSILMGNIGFPVG